MLGRSPGQHEFDAVIVSPNIAVDSYYVLPEIEMGGVNRAERVWHTAGGKGSNMARAMTLLGGRALVLGIAGGHTGRFIADELHREGIAHDLVWVEGETRRCSTVIVPARAETTVILEPGCPAGEHAARQLLDRAIASVHRAPFVTLIGSLPPDLPSSYYARLIEALAAAPITTLCLDSTGETLRLAAEAGPRIIKVNLHEFTSAFCGGRPPKWKDIQETFDRLADRGVEVLAITDGPRGAYVFCVDAAPFQVVTRVESWVSAVGAGDTFMAGLLLTLSRGEGLERAACFASAAAAANLQEAGCGFLDKTHVDRYLSQTSINRLV